MWFWMIIRITARKSTRHFIGASNMVLQYRSMGMIFSSQAYFKKSIKFCYTNFAGTYEDCYSSIGFASLTLLRLAVPAMAIRCCTMGQTRKAQQSGAPSYMSRCHRF